MAASTSLIKDSDQFIEYKYIISEFFIIIDGESSELPIERISDFKIENYFENAAFPIFKITAVVEPTRYYEMIKNKDKVKFKVRIQKFYSKNGDASNKSLYTDVINGTFIWYPEDASQDYEKSLKFEEGKKKDDDINKLDQIKNNIELFLFKDTVTGLRSKINAILSNCTLSTAVTYLLYKAGAKNVLMSPFENTNVYPQIVLPPQSIDKQIMYLNNNYGFHKNGSVVFFGLFHSYILNYVGSCTAWGKKEWKETVIYILNKDNTQSHLSGTFQRQGEERYYYNASSNSFDHSNMSVSGNVINGVDATVIDMKGKTTTKQSSNAVTVGAENSNILFNDSSNPYLIQTFNTQQKASSNVITLALENANIESFNPNKEVSIIFEDASYNKLYKGKYRIANAIHTFTRSGNEYLCTTALTLKKMD